MPPIFLRYPNCALFYPCKNVAWQIIQWEWTHKVGLGTQQQGKKKTNNYHWQMQIPMHKATRYLEKNGNKLPRQNTRG